MFFLYLDPGSGSFLIQLLIAGAAGIAIAIGASWTRVKRLFKKNKGESAPEENDDDEE